MGFIVTNMARPPEKAVAFYTSAALAQWIKRAMA
jgi:hypothetical protein